MVGDRAYRKALSLEEARREIADNATQFCPESTRALCCPGRTRQLFTVRPFLCARGELLAWARLRSWFDSAVPEDFAWTHTLEGPDDMPAHAKASLLGPSLTLAVRDGRFALGTWQGIYLCEHRRRRGARSLVVTLWGE